ncbi:hypothetical protein [Achromobacter phage Motura]|uniref:Uncharacterized protein n=1 Tax=Achromobacter phage Motura TaxID=2591403 RepID=A0A514CSK5_9CAUD|nr:hypothetical protein H1O15_gp047 [Achromobacter phage Motura]QDH83455.1 hypothetical protein [Achromobacter phage Motura]
MTSRKKLIAERDRQRKKLDAEREQAALQANYERLATMSGGFARGGAAKTGLKDKQKRFDAAARFGVRYSEDEGVKMKAQPSVPKVKAAPQYESHMLEREHEALEQTRKLKARVGIAGNKMGLQYLTDSDLEDEKKGLLRRRS